MTTAYNNLLIVFKQEVNTKQLHYSILLLLTTFQIIKTLELSVHFNNKKSIDQNLTTAKVFIKNVLIIYLKWNNKPNLWRHLDLCMVRPYKVKIFEMQSKQFDARVNHFWSLKDYGKWDIFMFHTSMTKKSQQSSNDKLVLDQFTPT